MKRYKIIKLKSGEELIGTVRATKENTVKIYRPMVFKSMVQSDFFGPVKELLVLKDWLMLSDDRVAVLSKESINTIINASVDAATLYEVEKQKQDKKSQNVKTKPQQNTDEVKDAFDFLNKHIEEMLQKNDKMYEQESNLKDLAKHKPDDRMVFMNLAFSPEVIVELLKSGIISRKEFGEIINEITNTNGEGMHPQKYTGNKKDKKNLGNDWTDWSADPSSEDYK